MMADTIQQIRWWQELQLLTALKACTGKKLWVCKHLWVGPWSNEEFSKTITASHVCLPVPPFPE